jgi:hypothetical protein
MRHYHPQIDTFPHPHLRVPAVRLLGLALIPHFTILPCGVVIRRSSLLEIHLAEIDFRQDAPRGAHPMFMAGILLTAAFPASLIRSHTSAFALM